MKTFRDYILIAVSINVFLHFNYPEYFVWAKGNREEISNFFSPVWDSVLSVFTVENIAFAIFMIIFIAGWYSIGWVFDKLIPTHQAEDRDS